MESLTDQILKSDVVPIAIEKELKVKCCVRGHQAYESNWDAKTGSKFKPCHEKRPSALVEDKYAMALKFNDTTVGHVPKFLYKTCSLVPMYLHQRMQKCTQNLKCLLKKPWNNTTIK